MNLSNISTQSLSEALAWTLLHSIWQAVLIAGLLAIVFRFINKNNAQLRYLMASISMLLIFCVAILTFILSLPDKVLVSNLSISQLSTGLTSNFQISEFSWAWIKSFLPLQTLLPILLRTWIIGICLLSIRMLINYINATRLKKYKAFKLDEKRMKLASGLLKRFNIKRKVIFRESDSVDSPSLIGYFKPVILLPISLLSNIPSNQLEIIIAHELAHISRHDYLVQLIQGVIEILFFYHPMVWWLSSVVNTEREHICDDLAVKVCGESLTLIKALNNMESIRRNKPELVLNFSGKKANLLQRVRRILNQETVRQSKMERGLLSVIFVFAFSGLVLFSNLANSENQIQQEPKQLTIFTIGDFESNEIPQASPINLEKKKKVKKNEIAPAPPKVIEPVKPEEVVAPEIPELPGLPIVLSDTIKVREVEEVIEVQKEALEEALNELEDLKVETSQETIKELEESLMELESIDINIEKELIEIEASLEIDRKEFEEIDNNKNLSKKEKSELKEKIKSSLKKINSEEFHQNIKESLERGKESLQRQLEKIKSGEFQKNIEIQKEKIKEMIEKFESPEFQENLKNNLEKSREHINERLKEIESPEFQKELKRKIKKSEKKNKKAKIKIDSKNAPLCILNGVEISSKVMDKLDPEGIESVMVLKDITVTEKYGEKGKNGVVLIKTKSTVQKNKAIKIKGETKNSPLYVVDGIEFSPDKSINDIDPDDIESMNVLKGNSAIEKYGKKAKNGVIEITTKK